MTMINLSQRELDALSRTAMSEVGHFGRYGETVLEGGVAAVVDTIVNRVAHPAFPSTIDAVVDAPYQFSAIGGPGGSGSWDKLKPASAAVQRIVARHLAGRARAASCTVKGATHFLNPHLSSQNALAQWGNFVVANHVAVWGEGEDVHYHGFAPGTKPPPAYVLSYEGDSCSFSGGGVAEGPPSRALDDAQALAAEAGGKQGGVAADSRGRIDAPAYKVERVGFEQLGRLESELNRLAAQGWRLRQIVSEQGGLLLVMEAFRPLLRMEGEGGAALRTFPVEPDGAFDMPAFSAYIESLALRHFRAEEFLVMGNQNGFGDCKGKNAYPARALWKNIGPTALVLDELRARLGAPIQTLSVYRSPAYNACISGASESLHMQFMAVDFVCNDGTSPVHWARQLKAMRDAGVFRGGIGVYQTFVHVDTRGTNARFGPLMSEVF